jgi:cytochrome c556
MIRPILVGLALAIGVSAAIAQSDSIADRRALMKSVGAATATGTRMSKGEVAFELDKAQDVLKTYAAAADKMHTYFPESAKTGGETTASPKIWENRADFRKRFDDWAADIKKAAANTKDLDTFKTEFANVTKACGSCHQAYRVSRS